MAYTTIDDPTIYFNTKLWTGTGSENAITGVGFQPDWVWIKNRAAAENHKLYDAVRGATKNIYSNLTNTEGTDAQSLKSFDSDGFTLGTESALNANGQGIVGWNWKANGQGSSNTDGSINTTYTSANTTAGFSISQYTGTSSAATIGHGLGAKPAMIIAKRLTGSAEAWVVYHQSLGGGTTPQDKYLHLNSSDAEGDSAGMWNDTAPTTSLFSVGSTGVSNGSGGTFVAYCFVEKAGYSKFNSYIGNGNDDGVFIETGFKPAFLLLKMSSGSQGWFLVDNKRAIPSNVIDASLHPNANAAEDTSSDFFVDFTSNGFKLRDSDAQLNGSGSTYIFMAFAAAPLVGTNNIPANAR